VVVCKEDVLFFSFGFGVGDGVGIGVGSLDGIIATFFAFSFVHFADDVNLFNDIAIDTQPLLRLKFFFLEH